MSLYQYSDGLPPEAKGRYISKLNLIGIESCPFKVPEDRWINDPQKWPELNYKDVYTYLIKSPRLYSSEAMDNYRSLDAHNYFVSGWVQTVFHIHTNNGNMVFKADVKPSYRVTDEPHHPWVALRKDGPVIAGHCDCMAGLGETCSHVGALLFKMEAAVRLEYTASACTDVSCKWNECFVKNVQPDRISNIKFYKPESVKRVIASKQAKVLEPATESQQFQFLQSLNALDNKVVGLAGFANFSEAFSYHVPIPTPTHLPKSLRSLYSNHYLQLCPSDFKNLCSRTYTELSLTSSVINYVKEVTLLQSQTQSWYDVRLGRITSSVVADVMKTSLLNPATSILKKICMPNSPLLNIPAVDWGKHHESDAFNLYSFLTGNSTSSQGILPTGFVFCKGNISHQHMSLQKTGFIISFEKPFLGASPDGLLKCSCCGVGVLEIKCPYKYRNCSLQNDLKCNTVDYIDKDLNINKKHKYYFQIQLEIYVSNADYADFFVWTPIDCILTRVPKCDSFIINMLSKLDEFWQVAILPELLLRKIESQSSCNKENLSISSKSTKKYCICKTQTNLNNMVGCDKCDEWYHPKCIGLKKLPRSKTWYCPGCII